jgi:CHAD domain-containing protein
MATVSTLPSGARFEHRGLTHWMDRVQKELESVRTAPDVDAVHKLRVAIRRCRSLASVMEEIDTDPAWPAMRKAARKLFRGLGDLRDAQVLDAWVSQLGPSGDPLREQLHAAFESREPKLREDAIRIANKFDEKLWTRLERHLRQRARLVPVGSLAAECLALERLEDAKELHARALRTHRPKPWHDLRIGLKRFRYTVENLLPEHYAAWSDHLKRVQYLLGDVHDLDVLAVIIQKADATEPEDTRKTWDELIARERHERIETYRQLTLGKTSLWNEWRGNLPHNGRLEAAGMARLRATARAVDTRPRRTSQVSRIAIALFDALCRAEANPLFAGESTRRILRAAARLHRTGASDAKSPQKAARKFLLSLALPPGWSREEWETLAWSVRYHRGPEPKLKNSAFAHLPESQQQKIRAAAGLLRLARALRKSGIETVSGLRAEKSGEALLLRVPGLDDSAESAARIAAAKHLLELALNRPLILKPVTKPDKLVVLSPQQAALPQVSAAASD